MEYYANCILYKTTLMKYVLTILIWALGLSGRSVAQMAPDFDAKQWIDLVETDKGHLTILPIEHASIVFEWQGKTIYIDPAADPSIYIKQKKVASPDLIFITDIHGDHMNAEVLQVINTKNAVIVAPQAVADKLPDSLKGNLKIIKNRQKLNVLGIAVEAIPMYNLPETADSRHPKGRGNGYILTIGGKRIYISGDTEDIPEMRALKNIDAAFVCMNLPYTMDIHQAASAVLEFKPKKVYPYHHRGQDIAAFKKLVIDENKNIDVRLMHWYP
jgi:L-ascorbate metabolism protein UlaG (beta-lactamase superfamily)